jgi:outer membrane protein TolC
MSNRFNGNAMKVAALIFAGMLLAARPASAEQSKAPEPLQLDRLIEIALEENQQLAALRSKTAAERAKVPQARALPDPMAAVGFDNLLHPDRGIMLEVRQMVPWPGKLRLMSEAAALSADRTVTEYTEKAYEVVAEVKKAYYDLYFLEKSIEIALANKDVLADFVKIAEAKYSVGAGIQQDVLRAQVAQSRILDDLLMLQQRETAARARLNALLNRPPDAPLGPAGALKQNKVKLDQRALEEIALERRAMLEGMRLMIAEADKMRALAKRELKPDYELRLGVAPAGGMEAGGTAMTGMVMVQVPLYRRKKQDKAIEQRGAELRSAQSEYEAQKTMVFSMIKETLAMLEANDRSAELYHTGIIPQAQLALESARAGYQVNKVDFLALLDSQMSLYSAYREYYRAVTEHEKAVAELERAIGEPLDAEVQR